MESKEELDAKAKQRALEYRDIDSAAMWPLWPYLPLKRRTKDHKPGDWPEFAFIFDGLANLAEHRQSKIPVYKISYDDVAQEPDEEKRMQKFQAAERVEYDSIDALLDDGWVVD